MLGQSPVKAQVTRGPHSPGEKQTVESTMCFAPTLWAGLAVLKGTCCDPKSYMRSERLLAAGCLVIPLEMQPEAPEPLCLGSWECQINQIHREHLSSYSLKLEAGSTTQVPLSGCPGDSEHSVMRVIKNAIPLWVGRLDKCSG